MRYYTVRLPERVIGQRAGCDCHMAGCANNTAPRGVTVHIRASNEREAWDKVHRDFPFEKAEVVGPAF